MKWRKHIKQEKRKQNDMNITLGIQDSHKVKLLNTIKQEGKINLQRRNSIGMV